MLAATIRPWYLPTCVSGKMPVTSPIAHRRSPSRRCESTSTPRGLGVIPTVSSPMSSTRGRRPVAASTLSPRTSSPLSSTSTYSSPSRRASTAPTPSSSSIPSRLSTSPSASPNGAGSRASTCAECSISTTSPPSRRDGLGELRPDRAAAEHEQPARDGLHRRRLAVRPDAVEPVQDRRDERVGAVREHDVLGRVAAAVDLHRVRPGEPALAAEQGDAGALPASAPGRRPSSRRP